MLLLNTGDLHSSAPSPVVWPVNFKLIFNLPKNFSIQPQINFFWNYYLFADGKARPAEIENRTAIAFSFLLDGDVVYGWQIKEKHRLEAGLGPSFLIRFATLANNVKPEESGETGSAQSDINAINSWFWNNGNFLHLKFNLLYLYKITETIQIGPEFRFYLPIGSFIDGQPMNETIFSLGIAARF